MKQLLSPLNDSMGIATISLVCLLSACGGGAESADAGIELTSTSSLPGSTAAVASGETVVKSGASDGSTPVSVPAPAPLRLQAAPLNASSAIAKAQGDSLGPRYIVLSNGAQVAAVPSSTTASSTSTTSQQSPYVTPNAGTTTVDRSSSGPSGRLTTLSVANTGTTTQRQVPVTFGETFAPGEVPSGFSVHGVLNDGSQIPLQTDVKARHPDGSLRHGIFSLVLPDLPISQSVPITLVKAAGDQAVSSNVRPDQLLNAGFATQIAVNIAGRLYTVPIESLLRAGTFATWLSGPVVNEWIVASPLVASDQSTHPHLSARVAIRHFATANKARVDVTIENDWAFEPSPQNFTYDIDITVGGQSAYKKAGLTHFHHARWRKTFWWNGTPTVQVKHEIVHLMASRALPNYDTSIAVASSALFSLDTQWKQAKTDPMAPGLVVPYMPTTGGRPDIGPLTQWSAMYLLSMDNRAEAVTLGVGDLAGSWPVHYRDKRTNRPLSINDYPYVTLLGRASDAINPATKKSELFPACGGDCSTAPYNYTPDSAHQPSLSYLPYLITGDHFHLEETQFWANWNMIQANPNYRLTSKGLFKWDQVRGQAWALRTLAQAAYITPDADPMKAYFVDRLNNNLDWYNTTYSNASPSPNKLGFLDGSGKDSFQPIHYPSPSGDNTGIAPWQDDFFTWTAGYMTDLGFTKAAPLLRWKAKFPIDRITGPGYCWIDAAAYTIAVKSAASAPVFGTIADAYNATMRASDGSPLVNSTGARYLDQPCGSQQQADWRTQRDRDLRSSRVERWVAGEMDGYANVVDGYPSYMQPALAVAATTGLPNADVAWQMFQRRTVKPNYSTGPGWAIVPRK